MRTRRCLWGWRPGYVQVGSSLDRMLFAKERFLWRHYRAMARLGRQMAEGYRRLGISAAAAHRQLAEAMRRFGEAA